MHKNHKLPPPFIHEGQNTTSPPPQFFLFCFSFFLSLSRVSPVLFCLLLTLEGSRHSCTAGIVFRTLSDTHALPRLRHTLTFTHSLPPSLARPLTQSLTQSRALTLTLWETGRFL